MTPQHTGEPDHWRPRSPVIEYIRLRDQIREDEARRDTARISIIAAGARVKAIAELLPRAESTSIKMDLDVELKALNRAVDEFAASKKVIQSDIDANVQRAFTINADSAAIDFFDVPIDDRPKSMQTVPIDIGGVSFNVSSETAASYAQKDYEYNNLSAAERARLGQDWAQWNNISPEQQAQIDIQLRTEGRLDKQLQLSVLDSQRDYELGTEQNRLSALGVDAQFQGLELTRRGQMIAAIGQDFANQIELGRLDIQQATLNLDRMDRALTQRRAEREQALQFAVSSTRLLPSGAEVTDLPGGAQLAAILSQVTGQEFGADMFTLPVTRIDPDAAARDVLNAGQTDQLATARLKAEFQASRDAISGIVGTPLGTQMANEAATQVAGG